MNMSDEHKDPLVDQKSGAEEKKQLSEEALSNVAGGEIVITKPADASSTKLF
jgi:hypothetical protein